MSVFSQINTLKRIMDRYFSNHHKKILHYGDCLIYRADRPFCSCGLIHQLHYLDCALASIVYPKFFDDDHLQEMGKKRRKNKKQDEECKTLLESIFGKIEPPTLENIKYDYDDFKRILDDCCATQPFPSAYTNLKRWLRKEIANR